ncbi:unnamed protein product [Cuscuta campestris]|uniref:Uncharacterized protein n=1 Tax=Cuscuta campestris TaxID=132261 RepID=A0A484LUI1_9ASTE|nr:unnamed protein product [Cuscuta campestris]
MGDFNSVLNSSERVNCHAYAMTDLLQFRLNNDLLDAKSTGLQFSWNRGNKWAKLDRVLVNCEWELLQWECWAEFKNMEFLFDHCAVLLHLIQSSTNGPKPFKFFNMWMKHEAFDRIVEDVWHFRVTRTRQFRLCKKLKMLKQPLRQLNKREFGHISSRGEHTRSTYSDVMGQLLMNPSNPSLIAEADLLRKKVTFFSDAERVFFQQKVKCVLINDGDKCSEFFHSLVKKQASMNSIPFIVTDQGTTTSLNSIVEEFLAYYNTIFGSTVPTTPIDWNVFREGPLLLVDELQNLTKDVEITEVKEALFSMGNDKAPWPNGYTVGFFNQKWNTVGNTLFEAVSEFFISGRLLKQLNHAIVVLIPKKINHIAFADDVMMFARGNIDSVSILAKAIHTFSQVYALHVNPQKSNIYLAGEIKDNRQDILDLVSFPEGKLPVRYLGLPLTSQRASERDFAPLVNKVDENIRKWNAKTLSVAGKVEILSAIQGIEGKAHCSKRKMWRLAILTTVYYTWKLRNGVRFDNEAVNIDAVTKIKVGCTRFGRSEGDGWKFKPVALRAYVCGWFNVPDWESGSTHEHAGVKVTIKDSDQTPSMDGDKGGNGSTSELAGVKVTVKDSNQSPYVHVSMDGIEGALEAEEYKSPSSPVTNDYDDDVNFVPESEEVDGEPLYPKLVVA